MLAQVRAQTYCDRWNPFVLVWPDETIQEAVARHYRQMGRRGFVVIKRLPREQNAA